MRLQRYTTMLVWIAIEVVLAVVCFGNAETEVLNLMLITSGGGQYNSSGAEPAVDLAIRLINENEVIHGHQLNIASRGDSSCNSTLALGAFLSNVSVGSDKIAVIGCGCSVATEAVAAISSFWNITHFSFASSSDALSDPYTFPYFWRTHTKESNLALSVVPVMREYNWNMLKIITQEESIFTQGTLILTEMLKEQNITVVTNGTNSFASATDVMNASEIFQPEVRIYFLNMYSRHARRVLCAAVKLQAENPDPQYYVPGYVWITLGWYRDQWWTEDVSQDIIPGCDDATLEPLIDQTIGIQQTNSAPDKQAPTDVILTASEFKQQYLASLGDRYFFEPTATYAYDALWAFAFALNSSLPHIEQQGLSVGNFSYSTGKNITNIIQEQLSIDSFGFEGVSGRVEFDNDGTRRAPKPQILTYRNRTDTLKIGPVLVAVINETTILYLNGESNQTVWSGDIPGDGSPIEVLLPVKFPLVVVYYLLASTGICFALVCLLFNIIFRNRKIVRLISPNLNYIIIAGGIMLYICACFFTISSTEDTVITLACHLRMWFLILGYFSCFGTIVVKMWRVYYIFHNPSGKRKKSRIPKDWHLFLIVLLVCGMMTTVMICVALFGSYGAVKVDDNETKQVRNETNNIQIQYVNLVCAGPLSLIWIFFSYGCVVVTQVVAVILAFRTRKVTIKALNDSKYLTIIIYVSSVIIALMLISAVLLQDYLNIDAAVFGGLIILFTTVVLGLTFIPKMVILYKDPKGENIFERGQSQGTLNLTAVDAASKNELGDLEKYCTELEGRLGKYEAVVPYRSFTRSSSIRKFSMSAVAPTSVQSVNPLSSLPTTTTNLAPAQINHATSGYLSEDSNNNNNNSNRPGGDIPGDIPKAEK